MGHPRWRKADGRGDHAFERANANDSADADGRAAEIRGDAGDFSRTIGWLTNGAPDRACHCVWASTTNLSLLVHPPFNGARISISKLNDGAGNAGRNDRSPRAARTRWGRRGGSAARQHVDTGGERRQVPGEPHARRLAAAPWTRALCRAA